MSTIGVADDERQISELLAYTLEREGHRVETVADGPSALRLARSGIDALVLDLGLPVVDGIEVLRTLRREGQALPVLVLTARGDEVDRVLGLELGADDYVTKPFSARELAARLRAILRRLAPPAPAARIVRIGALEIDESAREVRRDGGAVALKPREYALMALLAANPNVAFSRESLIERVWGFEFDGDARTVDVHVRRVRAKVEDDPAHPRLIATVRGFGYKLSPP
ncbi:MAG TPA: response regulator transcription factor [Candidatus Dormibacteraeota bacterium]|nr:response regulator transcription factor [Candidatus Dormibacteraeota bacterium]